MTQGPEVTAAATFCATLVDEWARAGLRQALVCPGSRSTPLALALAADDRLAVEVVHDERSAAFLALGVGLATGEPAVVLTTSGTAAAELHPAVVEAGLSSVPMIVCTADRPPEMQDVGAPQTIDQVHLFGRSVRWFAAPEVPDEARSATWRPLASRAVAEATGRRPGPVHLNLGFRDPLVGLPDQLPPGRDGGRPWASVDAARPGPPSTSSITDEVVARLSGRRGLVVAGGPVDHPEVVVAVADALGWPVVASPRATGLWGRGSDAGVVSHADALVRVPRFREERPEIVLRVGETPASKLLGQWLADVPVVAAPGRGRWIDPDGQVERVVAEGELGSLVARVEGVDPGWRARWLEADRAAGGALEAALDAQAGVCEPAVARDVVAALPNGATLVVASSMPVRDVEWYAAPRSGVRVLANRGANGIDGVVSTGVGVALARGAPTAVLLGDVAFLHDSNALLGLGDRGVDLTVVVVDNDGGGIFSFLPQAAALDPDRFELLFGTPHGVDLPALVAAHGIGCRVVRSQADLAAAVTESTGRPGTEVIVVHTDRAANVAVHDALHAAVAEAVDAARP